MACTPLNIQAGLFINVVNWSNAPSANFGGKTLTLTAGGPNPGILVQQGAKSLFHAQSANRSLFYMVLGTNFLVILEVDTGVGPSTRTVSLVDFSTWTEVVILSVLASSNAVGLPVVNPSQGNGSVFLAYGEDGTQLTSTAIYRSDNGKVLCSLGFSFIATGQTAGEATATQLIIHYSTGGTSQTQACPLPTGVYSVSPGSNSFPNVFVGGCPFNPPTKQFIIKNTGSDCLTITSIANNPPFSVQATSTPLPVSLAPTEVVTVTVAFNPAAVGNWNPANLIVAASDGNHNLPCIGQALAATFLIQFNATTFNFGKIPVGQPAPGKTLIITNTGSKPLSVSVPPLNVSGFACAGFNGTLNCLQAQTIAIAFTPPSVGPQSAVLSITSQAPGSPHSIALLGEGCIAHAEIAVPPAAPIDLGQVQQSFRTVKFFEVQNTGDGPLTFNGAISGPDAALFGLPDPNGSVTVAPATRSYTANPVSPCGSLTAGDGKVIVALSFFANAAPGATPRTGTLTLSGHNATNFPPTQTWLFPLTAVITAPVALDVALVVDHSGSMNDSLGSRVKIDAAVSASQLFVELLRPDLDDRVALVRFNHLPDLLVPMTHVSSTVAPTQSDIRTKVQTNIPPAAGNTAIAGGTMTGIKEIQKPRATTPAALTQATVVLTDGIENTAFEDPPGSGNWFSIMGGSLLKPLPQTDNVGTSPMVKPSGIKIYAIGIGKDSDIDPTQLGALVTSAQNFFRVNQDLTGAQYFQLEKYYTQIFMDVVGTSSISDPMYWISPGQTQEIEFDVLRGDVEALIVIFDYQGLRLPFHCVSPDGEIVDPAVIPPGFQLRSGWTSEARFVEFKMPLLRPDRYAGRWKVVVRHPGRVCTGPPVPSPDQLGFLPKECRAYKQPVLYGIAIGVGSNFRIMPFVTPNPVYVGDPILLTAVVSEAGLPVTGCNVTVSATSPSGATWAMTLLDDGAHSDGAVNDGEYADMFTHTYEAGTYHFLFHASGFSRDGEPVVREAVRDKAVLSKVPVQPPGGGGRPGDDECCQRLLKAIQEQTRLLENILKRGKSS